MRHEAKSVISLMMLLTFNNLNQRTSPPKLLMLFVFVGAGSETKYMFYAQLEANGD